jgi:hypothetical protein
MFNFMFKKIGRDQLYVQDRDPRGLYIFINFTVIKILIIGDPYFPMRKESGVVISKPFLSPNHDESHGPYHEF